MLIFLLNAYATYALYCDERTKVFTEHGKSNDNNFYFVESTYMATAKDRCDEHKYQTFRTKLEDVMKCSGQHCLANPSTKNSWGCKEVGGKLSQNCYQIEHIIPKKHNIPELSECDVEIAGNLVMSYGVWNQEMGNGSFGEKELIYGDIWARAYEAVYSCRHKKAPSKVPRCSKNYGILAFIIVPVLLGVMGMIAGCVKYFKTRSDEQYDSGYDINIDIDSMSSD